MPATVHSSSSASSPDSAAAAVNQAIQKSFSCVLCAQRKVKCDRAPGGCVNCTKARVPCVYKAPPPPRRRKKGLREMDTHARLRLYEDALRRLGVDPASLEMEELAKLEGTRTTAQIGQLLEHARKGDETFPRIGADHGVLVVDEGKSRYLENNMWTSLRAEFRDNEDLLGDESDEDDAPDSDAVATPESFALDGPSFLFGSPKSPTSLRALHPLPVQIFKIWQKYLENVSPLVKIFHVPTMQQILLDASGQLDDMPKNVEAVMFSIYAAALNAVSDSECQAIMGESKPVVLHRFQSAAQLALLNANFLKSADLMVLQAFILFLVPLHKYDPRIMWIFSGIAARIGQRLGLHRDGEELGLPPFETEIRRRVWWQTMFLEGASEKLAGVGNHAFMGDTKRPRNLNDSDLFPGMTKLPEEHEGATEMMSFLIRCQVGEFLKRTHLHKSSFNGFWNKLSTATIPVETKDKAIDELDAILQKKFVRYCDTSIPSHFVTSYMAKSVIAMMRFFAHSPEQYAPEVAATLPQSEKDMLFNICVQVITNQNYVYTTKELQGFIWHLNMHFQWKAFIHLISELRHRTHGPEVETAWRHVGMTFEFHPNFTKELTTRALPVAISKLTLRAWDAYTTSRGTPPEGDPIFIKVLRNKQSKRTASPTASASPPQWAPPFNSASMSTTDTTPLKVPEPYASSEEHVLTDPETLQSFPPPSNQFSPADDALPNFQMSPDWAVDLNASLEPDMPSFLDDPGQMDWSAWNDMLKDFKDNDPDGFGLYQGGGLGGH